MHRIIVSGIVALAAFVTACGGGGGPPADWNEKHITAVVKPKVEE